MKYLVSLISLLISSVLFSQMDIVLQTGNRGTINDLEFHPTKKLLLSTDSKRAVIWDIQQRKQFSSIEVSNPITGSGFLNDSTLFISSEYKIQIWDFYTNKLIHTHTSETYIKQVKSNNNMLYILSNGIKTLNHQTNQVGEIPLDNMDINSIEISPNGALMGISTEINYLVYNLKTFSTEYTINLKNAITSCISDSSKAISIAVAPASIHTYSIANNKLDKLNVIVNDRTWNTYSSIYLVDNYGISGDSEDVITTYNTKKGKVLSLKKNDTESISKIAVNKDRSVIAIGGENGVIQLYDNTFNLFHTLKPISPVPTCIKVLNDSAHIIIGYDNGELKKWNINTHQVEEIVATNLKNSLKKKQLKIVSIDDFTGILEVSWKTNISNNAKNQFYTIKFNEQYSTYDIEKNDDYISSTTGTINPKMPIQLANGETITALSNISLNQNFLVGSSSGFIYLINAKGEQILKMVSPTNKSFFYTTPDNFYYASKSALQHVGARYKSQLIGFEQIDLVYNRPDKIIPLISTNYSTEYIDLLEQAYVKRLKKLNIKSANFDDLINLPTIETTLSKVPTNTKEKEIQISISARSTGPNLKAIHILINDSPIYGKNGLSIEPTDEYHANLTLQLSTGKNKIQIFVENEFGSKSLRQKATTNADYTTQPTLHLLTIGSGDFTDSDYNLKYASKDATDMGTLFQKSKQFKEIKTYSIIDKNVTNQNIYKEIENLEKANINDVIIVFFAGHGILDQNLDYFLSTYNINFNNPSENGLNFDAFEDKLSTLKCRHKLLLIDACHSGELDKDEIQDNGENNSEENEELLVFRSGQKNVELIGGKSAFELSKNIFIDLRSTSGVVTISSAGAAEYALEGENWQNGAFTYCLLKGIVNKKADLNNDNTINTNELQEYLFIEVPKLTNGKQTPTSRVELMNQNFIIW